jgi:hypothetical protein
MLPCLDLFVMDDNGDLICVQVGGAFNVNDCVPARSFFAEDGTRYLLLVYGYNEQESGGDFNLTVSTLT